MKEQAKARSSSLAPSAMTVDRLPSRQRWDHRYASLPPEARTEPTPFVTSCLVHLPARGRALDVAAGAGRHAVALARRGLHVDAVDISWQGLRLARQRAISAGVEPVGQVRLIVADIERPWLPHAQYELILISFFLHRPLFSLIKDRLQPGGWLAYETFTIGQKIGPNNRPIRQELLLKPGELKAAFSDFEILLYDEDEHNGKVTAQLLARKPNKEN